MHARIGINGCKHPSARNHGTPGWSEKQYANHIPCDGNPFGREAPSNHGQNETGGDVWGIWTFRNELKNHDILSYSKVPKKKREKQNEKLVSWHFGEAIFIRRAATPGPDIIKYRYLDTLRLEQYPLT